MAKVTLPRVVPRRNLDSILSSFTKTLDQLDSFITEQNAVTTKADGDIAAATDRKNTAAAGIDRARGIRARIAEIVG